MILEEATYDAFNHYPSKLSPKSHKLIIVSCEFCGEFRVTNKHNYRTFCSSCSVILSSGLKGKNNPNFGKFGENSPTFGRNHTDEEKALMSTLAKGKYEGEKNPFFGKQHTEETLANLSATAKKRTGKKNSNFRGGLKVSDARRKAKRKRELGFKMLLPSKEEGEVWHHVTNEYVIGIPKHIHEQLGGLRKKHRALILKWLKENDRTKYNLVVCILIASLIPSTND